MKLPNTRSVHRQLDELEHRVDKALKQRDNAEEMFMMVLLVIISLIGMTAFLLLSH